MKWVGSSLGNVFGTIGDDNKFKLWREDFSQAAHSGRRFRCIFSQSPSNHVAYVSLDIHTIKHDVWLCLITHDGLLSLWEPLESESLGSWKELDAVYPFGQYSRGSEPTFRLSFHKSERPNHSAISAGLDPRTLSIALSATNVIKINRAFKLDDGGYQLNEVLEMNTHAVVINDIAWAPGCIHMRDLIATACDDGCTRVFEVTTPHNRGLMASGSMESPPLSLNKQESSGSASHTKSGIGAGLENASRVKDFKRGSGTQWIRHEWKQVAKLAHRENLPAWRVQWLYDGELTFR